MIGRAFRRTIDGARSCVLRWSVSTRVIGMVTVRQRRLTEGTPVSPSLIAAALAAACMFARWAIAARQHRHRMAGLQHRIHVNGIRGKSTVTRLIAGVLREAGIETVAKTTGSAAAIIGTDGVDVPIVRRGPATILEQLAIVRGTVTPSTQALAIECMAINPTYQAASEELIVESTIGVLTNVREDHQDVMGETLPEIARSLLATCPTGGILVTAETNPDLVPLIEEEAARRGSSVVVADPALITDAELAAFDYVAFKDNVAIGLAVAAHLGIDRAVAMRGMVKAAPDPGALRIEHFVVGGREVIWANLFAVNDRESMIIAMDQLTRYRSPETTVVGILNNRADRERRALQFADVAVNDLHFDRLATFGVLEEQVSRRLVRNGYPEDRIVNLGARHEPTLAEILDGLVAQCPTPRVVLVGFVNIHTLQAEMLMEFFDSQGRVEEHAHGSVPPVALTSDESGPAAAPGRELEGVL